MLNHALAQEVLNTALATGGDFAELFLEDRRDNTNYFPNSLLYYKT